MLALSQYNSFASGYSLEIWNLSQQIENLSLTLSSALNSANNVFRRSFEQIEANVESESRKFISENTAAENAFREWENINGKTGYEKFRDIVVHVSRVMIPSFNSFLQKVPRTQRIQEAAGRAQEVVTHIESGYQAFPTFNKLPSPSTSFPYEKYGKDERKYGEQRLIDFLKVFL
ncbi:hypothetical protein [Aliamphritea spongicola]|nr:hypothetical protein [Aliamphritea spongicola]